MISLFKVFLSKGEAVGRDGSYSQAIPYLVIIILEQKCFIIYLTIVGSRTSTTQESFYELLTGKEWAPVVRYGSLYCILVYKGNPFLHSG